MDLCIENLNCNPSLSAAPFENESVKLYFAFLTKVLPQNAHVQYPLRAGLLAKQEPIALLACIPQRRASSSVSDAPPLPRRIE
jgi:hypothetical protein